MHWITLFEEEFSIIRDEKIKPYLIIEGECRYLQALGGIRFALSAKKYKSFFNRNGCTVYDNFDVVSFLVTNWIKIQDSLEMLFNLLTGDPVKSLKMLSYLREKSIPTEEFSLYLYQSHKIILINRFNYPPKHKKRKSQRLHIISMIKSLNSQCHYLIVGDRPHLSISSIGNVIEIGKIIHPSGVVLNNYRKEYFRTWYQLNDNACKYKTSNFSLLNFKRL
ncbi:hypothetical protein [Aeromonas hydrophila]|uniref:hypothetical protein n=1 Tax=Aeromonas hydrophila TaxID=644 RepID=UPI001A903D31|nr:hypothetical protein [Aeromonas hydrophila]MBQ4665335.1 hypothetical protein [Aeromonas hydrophila]MBQ4713527.1 hypothetical protein [Aeromonas hydrophila]MBW3825336.1 hypothetical protein [Aeromonas hydrophila]MBW5270296.1 hypothetical protein [Aeromonas hydrophila]QSR50448.1 hypothetical protein GO458_03530 [Aeromonas hydrophila]